MFFQLIRWIFFNGLYRNPVQKRKGLFASLISFFCIFFVIIGAALFAYKNLDMLGINRKEVFGIDLVDLINKEKVIKINTNELKFFDPIIELDESIDIKENELKNVIKNKILHTLNKKEITAYVSIEHISCKNINFIELIHKKNIDNCFIEIKKIENVSVKHGKNYYLASYQINSIILKNKVLLNNINDSLEKKAVLENQKLSFRGLNISNDDIMNIIIKKEYDALIQNKKSKISAKKEECPLEINTIKLYVKFDCSIIKYVLKEGNAINSIGDEMIFNTELEEIVFTDIRI